MWGQGVSLKAYFDCWNKLEKVSQVLIYANALVGWAVFTIAE